MAAGLGILHDVFGACIDSVLRSAAHVDGAHSGTAGVSRSSITCRPAVPMTSRAEEVSLSRLSNCSRKIRAAILERRRGTCKAHSHTLSLATVSVCVQELNQMWPL